MNTRTILATSTHLTALAYNNADYGTTITLPVGRIVWGHPGKPKPATDNKGQPKMGKDGVQMQETSFGIAIPTAEFEAQVWPVMYAESAKRYPNGAPQKFSWKMTRDTDIDPNGKPYSEREGYAGCVVLAVSTMLEPPRILRWDAAGNKWQQMESHEIKTGDFVQPEINFKVNVPSDPTHTPSMYVNPVQIAFVGYGQEIVGSFISDPNQAFGNGPPPMPAGASATPTASAGGQPGMPGAPAAAAPGNAAAMPGSTPAPTSTAPAPPPITAPPQAAAPARPTEPTHVFDNGDGTEQWFMNGAWDQGRHPKPVEQPAAPAAPAMPAPAAGFVAEAAGQPTAAPGGAPAMPGAPAPR